MYGPFVPNVKNYFWRARKQVLLARDLCIKRAGGLSGEEKGAGSNTNSRAPEKLSA
jgi:hypothetical protein